MWCGKGRSREGVDAGKYCCTRKGGHLPPLARLLLLGGGGNLALLGRYRSISVYIRYCTSSADKS